MTLKRHLTLCLLAALAASPVSAADGALSARALATAKVLAVPSDHAGEAYAIVESLTTEVGPRMAGSEAEDRAVAWAQAKFKALGYDRVYLEPVSFPTWQRRRESGEVLGPYPQRLHLTALGGTVGTGGKPLEAEVVVEFATIAELKDARPVRSRQDAILHRMERFARPRLQPA